MATDADDELDVIQAIYCQPGETSVLPGESDGRHVVVRLRSDQEGSVALPEQGGVNLPCLEVELHLHLSPAYPTEAPSISVLGNDLSPSDAARLRAVLVEAADASLGQPMLMDLITITSQELDSMASTRSRLVRPPEAGNSHGSGDKSCQESRRSAGAPCDDEERMALLHLDHMRAKTNYCKVIRKWTAELSLRGRLLFCQRLILILLQGPITAIKEYIVRQRTCNVDVDSKGHSCKERMMSVLGDSILTEHIRFDNFDVIEIQDAEHLKKFFEENSLTTEFYNQVRTLKHFPGKR